MSDQALVLVDPSQPETVLARVSQLVNVTQRLPPRLVIIQGERGQFAAVRALPGVIAVYEDAVPEPDLRRLTDSERLFAEAWVLGRKPKTRPGEGLPWDAPGFEPPDGPDGGSKH